MEYNGWTLYDEVTIVIKENVHDRYRKRKYDYPQAYIVNPKDSKQLKAAISWGEIRRYEQETIQPKVVTVKNEGFEIQLLDSANNSCQGGKLSFWDCLVRSKEYNLEFVVGISSDILIHTLLQNDFKHGLCTKTVEFARMAGNLGVLTKDMEEYKVAKRDMQTKKDVNKGKTSKWQVGKNYITLTLDEVYLGDLYKPFNTKYESRRSYYDKGLATVLHNEECTEKMAIISTEKLRQTGATSLSELRSIWMKQLDTNLSNMLDNEDLLSKRRLYSSELFSNIPLFHYSFMTNKKKTPARKQGDFELKIDMDLNDFYTSIIEYAQDNVLKLYDRLKTLGCVEKLNLIYIDNVILRTESFDLNSLTEKEQRIIDIIKEVET